MTKPRITREQWAAWHERSDTWVEFDTRFWAEGPRWFAMVRKPGAITFTVLTYRGKTKSAAINAAIAAERKAKSK